jgi:hypothetical protein
MNNTKLFFEKFKVVWAQTTLHIGELQKVDIFLAHKSHNTSHRLLQHHTYGQRLLLQPFGVQVQGVPSNSHNTMFTGDIGLP